MPDFRIQTLGRATVKSPIVMSSVYGDGVANYVQDNMRIFFNSEAVELPDSQVEAVDSDVVERAGPREHIYFNPAHVHAAIVTCGGICPGLNNVIRSLVRCLWYSYGVRRITGIKFGYQGLVANTPYEPVVLNPDIVDDIQEKGGTILGSARGGGEKTEEIVDTLESMNINILFTIGGDGTLRGASFIADEVKKRGLKIAVVGVPKTVDNDLSCISRSFGVDTAVQCAVTAVRSAHIEAKAAINGIGLVKVMGRESGFIAAFTSLAQSDVNFCLIPENPFDLEGPNGFLANLKERIVKRGHAVILVAEGAGQDLLTATNKTDASGNTVLSDIGVFLKEKIIEYFKKEGIPCNLKYIDPSYIIRSQPADSYDSIFCARLGSHAVHAAMAGKTDVMVSYLNGHYVYIPIPVAVKSRNKINTEGSLWRDVLENTRQKALMKN